MGNVDFLYTVNTGGGQVKKTDYHIHTVYSDGKNTLEECIKAAIDKGLCAIAFTDHIWRTSKWIDSYIKEYKELKSKYSVIRIHIGAEAKVINREGGIDISKSDAEKLDFVVGSVHRRLSDEDEEKLRDLRKLSPQEAAKTETELIIAMTRNPLVDVIGHPMRLYYKFFYNTGKTKAFFPENLLWDILLAVKFSGKKIELNFNVPEKKAVIDMYQKSGVDFILGSDAHEAERIGDIPFEEIARQCRNAQ